jgi:hypothetical protein
LAKRKVDGLSFKAGSIQSRLENGKLMLLATGGTVTQSPSPSPSPLPTAYPVGGETVGIDTLSVFLSKYWLLLLLLLIPVAFALYKNRSVLSKWFLRLTHLLKGL